MLLAEIQNISSDPSFDNWDAFYFVYYAMKSIETANPSLARETQSILYKFLDNAIGRVR